MFVILLYVFLIVICCFVVCCNYFNGICMLWNFKMKWTELNWAEEQKFKRPWCADSKWCLILHLSTDFHWTKDERKIFSDGLTLYQLGMASPYSSLKDNRSCGIIAIYRRLRCNLIRYLLQWCVRFRIVQSDGRSFLLTHVNVGSIVHK